MMPDEWGPTTAPDLTGGISNLTNLRKWSDTMMSDEQAAYFPTNDYSNLTTFYITFFDEENERYINSSSNATDGPSITMPVWRQVVWIVLFTAIVVVATVGNLVVIWIVVANKRMRTVTNYFLVNLSVADAMMSTLNVTFNSIYMLYEVWPFGVAYCKFNQFVATLSICASVFTLMAISIDRYVAIMSPFRPRLLGKRGTLGIAAAIWVGSAVFSFPNAIYFIMPDIPNVMVCCWAEEEAQAEFIYNIVYMCLTYFVPVTSMTYTYAKVGVKLWGSEYIGECTQRQLENAKSKRRVVKMMIVVVLIFAVCWLPFHVYFIVVSIYPDIPVTHRKHIQEVYLGIYWLAMSNSMYNPIIYCWMNSKFRRGFKQFFWCCGALGAGGLRRHRGFDADHLDRSVRSLSPSRRNGTSTIRMSMHSTLNATMVTST